MNKIEYPVNNVIDDPDFDYTLLDNGAIVILGKIFTVIHEKKQIYIDATIQARMLSVQALLDKFQVNSKKLPDVFVSGGDTRKIGLSEASLMKMLLEGTMPDQINVKNTSGESDIYKVEYEENWKMKLQPIPNIIEDKMSRTTIENAKFLSELLPESNRKIFLITSEFHMPRSKYVFDCLLNQLGMPDVIIYKSPCIIMDPKRSQEYQKGITINSQTFPHGLNNFQIMDFERFALNHVTEILQEDGFDMKHCNYDVAQEEINATQNAFLKRWPGQNM